jgi:DNA polymerase
LAWLTSCSPMLEAFAAERDLYIEFAAQMYRTPYDQVTKLQRQIAKPAVLSCGYGTGGGELREDKKGDEYKSGLWGYAESMGVSMTQAEAQDAVYLYRDIYPEVPTFWYGIEDAVRQLLEDGLRRAFNSSRGLSIALIPSKLLAVTLPSGRRLHYLRPALIGGDLTFEGLLIGKTWGRRKLYGSLLTENIVQAIARDILAVGMARAHDAGFVVVSHTHDELLCQHDALDKHHSLTYLKDVMTAPVSWAPGLMIKAEGWEGEVYRK